MPQQQRHEYWSRRFRVGLAIALILWGIIYTMAYSRQEARLEATEAKVEAFKHQIEEVSRRHDVLLTYVITLREQLARNGFKNLPPMISMEKTDEDRQTDDNPERR